MKDRLDKRIKLTNTILSRIAEIDELKGKWSGSINLNPRILGQLKRSVVITSTGASTRIEGAQMSDEEIERFLRGLHQKAPQNRDEQEVAGYADLLGRIFDHHDSLKITEGQILSMHEMMLKYSEKDALHRGKYKTTDNTVAIVEKGEVKTILFAPTPPWLVKKEMDDVLDWTGTNFKKGEIHPLVVIANFIFEFLAIHPFEDGNGRLSRALTNLMLLQNGYAYTPYVSLEEIVEERGEDYYLALRKTQKNHKTEEADITPWLLFLLECLLAQAKRAESLLNKEDPIKLLSENQKVVFDLFAPDTELSVSEIQAHTSIPLPTIKQAVGKLVEHGLLERLGQGPATRYKLRE